MNPPIMALILERRLSKDQVLELYLNDVWLGQRGSFAVHGVDEASRLFFAKNVSNVSLSEAALIAGVILCSITGAANGNLLTAPRVFFAMARDGLLPDKLASVHPRYHTPHVVTLITGIGATIAAAFLPVGKLADYSNSGTLFAFAMVAVAVMVAVAEGLFNVGGGDCAEASDSSRFTAQPHRLPPSSITNRVNLAVIIGGTAYVPPRPLDLGSRCGRNSQMSTSSIRPSPIREAPASVPPSCTAKRASTALRRRWVKLARN